MVGGGQGEDKVVGELPLRDSHLRHLLSEMNDQEEWLLEVEEKYEGKSEVKMLVWTGGKLTSGSEGVVDEGEPSALCIDAWGVVGPG